MKTIICSLSLFIFICQGTSQAWIDTLYTIQTITDIDYGEATDFAGSQRSLKLDISFPGNDIFPECGRPLLVMIHGGAWFAGDKMEGYAKRIREDFAKRGYTTAAVNYRLGQFQTNQSINCNIEGWNCFNMTDTSEWYRANYRAVQDVNGAIRYLINQAAIYHIDPNNVFVVGESAGAFVALGVGYLDDSTEVLENLVTDLPDVPSPNTLYETDCIQAYQLANTIDEMNLSRPNLGDYEGYLNQPATVDYTIRAVGSYYGGIFNNIFTLNEADTPPPLYLYHQPCDLIAPYDYNRLLTGYVNCLQGFPAFCGNIINRPFVYGSYGIKKLLDTMSANGMVTPEYYFDNTNNQWNCLQQLNANQVCHAIDNYWLRTTNMATFFASKIETCVTVNTTRHYQTALSFIIRPNPAVFGQSIEVEAMFQADDKIKLLDLNGHLHYELSLTEATRQVNIQQNFTSGIYLLQVQRQNSVVTKKLLIFD